MREPRLFVDQLSEVTHTPHHFTFDWYVDDFQVEIINLRLLNFQSLWPYVCWRSFLHSMPWISNDVNQIMSLSRVTPPRVASYCIQKLKLLISVHKAWHIWASASEPRPSVLSPYASILSSLPDIWLHQILLTSERLLALLFLPKCSSPAHYILAPSHAWEVRLKLTSSERPSWAV